HPSRSSKFGGTVTLDFPDGDRSMPRLHFRRTGWPTLPESWECLNTVRAVTTFSPKVGIPMFRVLHHATRPSFHLRQDNLALNRIRSTSACRRTNAQREP